MDEMSIPSREHNEGMFQQVLSSHGGPAYIRRARGVELALTALQDHCRRQREEWLKMPSMRLGILAKLAGDWQVLQSLLVDQQQLLQLQQLHEELAPEVRGEHPATGSRRKLRNALRQCTESFTRFNKRWETFLEEVDLSFLNELREGYNRFYVLEKECVVRSARLARHGFEPLEPLQREELLELFPLLPVLELVDA